MVEFDVAEHREVEQRAHRGAHGFRIVDIHAALGQHHRVRAGGVGCAQDGSGVARVLDAAEHSDQFRLGFQHLAELRLAHGHHPQDPLRALRIRHGEQHFPGDEARCQLAVGQQRVELGVAFKESGNRIDVLDEVVVVPVRQ